MLTRQPTAKGRSMTCSIESSTLASFSKVNSQGKEWFLWCITCKKALGMLGSMILPGFHENSSLWVLIFCVGSFHFFTTMDREVFQISRLFQRPFHLRAKMQQSQGLVLILLSMVNQVNQAKPR